MDRIMMYIGIDPGAAGAIALLAYGNVKVSGFSSMSDPKKTVMAIHKIVAEAKKMNIPFVVGLEKQVARQGDQVFTSGQLQQHYGLIIGSLISFGVWDKTYMISPVTWKNMLGVIVKDKTVDRNERTKLIKQKTIDKVRESGLVSSKYAIDAVAIALTMYKAEKGEIKVTNTFKPILAQIKNHQL